MGYTLTDVVNEKLAELGESTPNKFARFYQFAVSGLRKFNMNTSGVPKMVTLTIADNDTAPLPLDYMKYTKIGLCLGGQIYCLGLNNDLCLGPVYDNCGVESAQAQSATYTDLSSVPNPLVSDNFRNGEFMGRMFGIGGDNNILGYYRIDKDHNRILFSGLSQTSDVVMEYIADINAINGDFEVHPYSVEALKDWIMWKYKENSNKPLGEQQMAKENFHDSSRLMRRAFSSNTLEEWVQAFASGNMAAPKM